MTIPDFTATSLRDILVTCSELFEKNERFAREDHIIAIAIQKFPGNGDLEVVLPKTLIINSFYGTAIRNTSAIAKHIVKCKIDIKLQAGDVTVVEDLRHGHNIRIRTSGREFDFYSFATKYAALHQPAMFPLFDNLVKRFLSELNRQQSFHDKFTQPQLRDFNTYKSVVDNLISFTRLERFKYKCFDQGIWVLSKYLYASESLEAPFRGLVQEAVQTIDIQ